jgi:hypothetical protein
LENSGLAKRFAVLAEVTLPGTKLAVVGRLLEVEMNDLPLTSLPMNLKKSFLICAALVATALISTGTTKAQSFSYSHGDVLVCFRNTATPAFDLVVNAGSITAFTNLPVGNKITISYSASQLAKVGTNNLAWCVCAGITAVNSGTSKNNMWISRPRASLNTQTTPWNTGTANFLLTPCGDIDGNPSLGFDATIISDTVINTATVIVEKEAGHTTPGQLTGDCYAYYVGAGNTSGNADFVNDDFGQGIVEQTTPSNFSTSGQSVRADFYQLLSKPSGQPSPGTYLGYFEFSTNGVMTYTAGPSATAVTAPTITAFSRTGTTNIITFTSILGGTYNLIGTNDLTIPKASWPVIGASVAGSGSPMSITNVTANALNYYSISAH